MGKHRERQDDYDFDDGEAAQTLFADVELDDETFFEQYHSKKTRRQSKRARNARRRIEEYLEDRQLADRLEEYYYRTDD